MKAWWSDHYSEENRAWLTSIFGPPSNMQIAEICFMALPKVPLLDKCRILVYPCTTAPQDIADHVKVIHLQGHPFLHRITPTVELTWQLILRLVRPIDAAIESTKRDEWYRFPFGADRMLSRMNLLVVGRGRIGSRVENVGLAFGMKVEATNSPVNSDILGWADIITLHTPPFDYTILGGMEFRHMKRGVFIVNTAQGDAIEAWPLIDGLWNGLVAGAALDVLPRPDNGLRTLKRYAKTHDNLIMTPHIGGSTRDAWHETQRMVIEKALEYLEIKTSAMRVEKTSPK